jgi:hypothetical protein
MYSSWPALHESMTCPHDHEIAKHVDAPRSIENSQGEP